MGAVTRNWQATGAPADEAALLLERVRVSDLTRERLELAAYCGHPASRLALGQASPKTPRALLPWLQGLGARSLAAGVTGAAFLAMVDVVQAKGRATTARGTTLKEVALWARKEGATVAELKAAVAYAALSPGTGAPTPRRPPATKRTRGHP